MLLKLLYILLCFVPVIIFIALLYRDRLKARTTKRSPFTHELLRPPGESLRLKIQEMDERLNGRILVLVIVPVAFAFTGFSNPQWLGSGLSAVIVIPLTAGVLAVMFATLGRKVWKQIQDIHDYELGFQGERYVAEELNQLLRQGFHVFHDIPFDKFNIDHVIVGTLGVYAVETKTRRKFSAAERGKSANRILFDGKTLTYPHGNDNHGLDQAKRNADSLATWLSSATGDKVSVHPILTFPGWWVERTGTGTVTVVNPKEIPKVFPKTIRKPLDDSEIQRIVHQLEQKCRTQ